MKSLRKSLFAAAVTLVSSIGVVTVVNAAESDGTVDLGYGASGIASFAGNYRKALALSDGKMVMFADVDDNSDYNPDKVEVKRFTTAGALDTSFGLNGTMTIQPSGHTYVQYEYSFADSSGGFYMTYTSNDPNAGPMSYDAGKMIKVTSAGVQDLNFGTSGVSLIPAPAGAQSIGGHWIDATSGKIYLAEYGNVAAIARLNSDGTPDSSFGTGGIKSWPYSGSCGAFWRAGQNSIWVDPSETYAYVSSVFAGPSSQRVVAMAKLNLSSGQCDTTFGGDVVNSSGSRTPDGTPDGYVEYTVNGATSLEGKFTFLTDGSLLALVSDNSSTLNLVKITNAGALDTSFNGTGISANLWSAVGAFGLPMSTIVLPSGDIYVVGKPDGSSVLAKIVKLTSGGLVDTSFGSGGIASTPNCQSLSYLGANRLSDGSIIVNSVQGTGYPAVYNTYLVKLGSGGSSSQCGTTTTTTTTTQPPMPNPSPNTIGSSMSNMCTGGQGMSFPGGTGGTFDFMVSMCGGTNVYVGIEGTGTVSYSFKDAQNNWVPGNNPTMTSSAPTKADLTSYPRTGTLGIKVMFNSTGTYKIYTVNETCYNSLASSSSLVTSCSTNNYGYWTINIVGGGSNVPQPSACTAGAASSNNQAITFDTSFGTGGASDITPSGKSLYNIGSAKTASGKLLLAVGYSASNGPGGGYLLMRFGSDGTPDSTFGTNGVKTVPSANSGTNINIGSVVANNDGTFFVSLSENTYANSNTTTAGKLLKLDANGDLVASFGTGGAATLATTSGNGGVYIGASKVLADGSVMVLANEYGGQSSVGKIYKVSSTGTLDSSFATAGVLTLSSSPRDFTVDDSGRIVVAGNTGGVSANATVTRYSAAGALDSTFGTSGVVTVDTSSSRELGYQVDIAGGKFYLLDQISAGGMSPTATVRIVRLNADGTIDTTYGSNGYADAATGSYMFRTMTVAPSGAATVGLYSTGMSMDAGVVFLDANGAALAGTGTTPMTISAGTCGLSDFDFISVDSSVFVIGSNFSGMDEKGFIIKANLSGIELGGGAGAGGGSVANAPTLVTASNQAALVRKPGSQGMLVNGQEVTIDSNNIDIPAALVPAAQRTPAQVSAIQAAGASLLAAFQASLPAGSVSNVAVVNTATGAVMQNLVFDANGNSVDVPVEDIVFLDGPAISLLIGSNNANITADGKYQVGAGGTIGVTGSGLGANAAGELVAMSTPTLLSNFTTSAQGDFSKSATLPSSIGVGDHTLVVATGNVYSVMGIRVVPSSLPATGSSNSRTVVIALFTLVFAAIIFRGRRLTLV